MVTSFFRSNFGLSFGRVQGAGIPVCPSWRILEKPESVPDRAWTYGGSALKPRAVCTPESLKLMVCQEARIRW